MAICVALRHSLVSEYYYVVDGCIVNGRYAALVQPTEPFLEVKGCMSAVSSLVPGSEGTQEATPIEGVMGILVPSVTE